MDSEPDSQGITDKLEQWPPAEGRYVVGDKASPIAVCTMASVDIKLPMERIAISGKCVTENLGIEKIVRNVVANPNIRHIIVVGRESMGHFVDNALESLVENGVDEEKRIIGAKGGIPVLKNSTNEEIERFRKQVQIINMAGEIDPGKIMEKVNEILEKPYQPVQGQPVQNPLPAANSDAEDISREASVGNQGAETSGEAVQTHQVSNWVQDPKGYFTIQVNLGEGKILVEHHEASGKVLNTMTGRTAEDIYHHVINQGLVSRLDHAAYLGRELAKAETAIFNKSDYEQDTGLVVVRTDEKRIDTDGKEIVPLPTHGKLIAVKKIEQTRETVLTYLVNDREFPMTGTTRIEEDNFREFLKGCGMHRVF